MMQPQAAAKGTQSAPKYRDLIRVSASYPSVMERYQSMMIPCHFEPMTTSGGCGNEPYRKN